MFANQPSSPLSVSQLNRQVKQLLETQYPAIPVQGEISTLSRPASGHIYFTLKDQNAQIRCAMFKGSLARSQYLPKQGDEVIAIGRLSLYEGRGDYQLIVSHIQPVGDGLLQAEFFKLKAQLDQEGLFAPEHKLPLPVNIQKVGVVTSATGAAFQDILTVLQRRFPAINVILYPTSVQGNDAIPSIVGAIELANQRQEVDILIIGRGGGSLEDLWCFNTEAVARSIFASTIPTISAVGHEVDVSISDFVADQRAATPSQAAELVSPDQFELMQQLDAKEQRLNRAVKTLIKQHQQHIGHLESKLKNPVEMVVNWRQKMDMLSKRLRHAIQQPLVKQTVQINHLNKRLQQASPAKKLTDQQDRLNQLRKTLATAAINAIDKPQQQFQQTVSKLHVLSPLATLERGYSITRDATANIVLGATSLKPNDEIETILKEGRVISTVLKILPEK